MKAVRPPVLSDEQLADIKARVERLHRDSVVYGEASDALSFARAGNMTPFWGPAEMHVKAAPEFSHEGCAALVRVTRSAYARLGFGRDAERVAEAESKRERKRAARLARVARGGAA